MVRLFALALMLCVSAPLNASEPVSYYLPPGANYDPAIPTPEDGMEHPVADFVVSHGSMVSYLRDLARVSDRVTVETVGYSHERRPILELVITSPENHARIDEIRASHLAALDPDQSATPSADDPVVTWIGSGIHGNEISVVPATMLTAYHFAAGQGPEVEKVLDESVIVMLAIHNPDGFNRASTWFRSQAGAVRVTDPAHKEHSDRTFWPGGRVNHYWFDLNRQWVVLTQPESKAWMDVWQKWRPTVSADLHEQLKDWPYFFSPGEPAQRNPYVPGPTFELQADMANSVRDVMDDLGELYFTEEFFDDFNPAMGSNYPLLTGTVSFLFENAGFTGRSVETVNGIETFERRIRRHSRASIAFANGAVERRAALLDHQRGMQRLAVEEAGRDPVKAYVFAAPQDPVRVHLFNDMLTRHGIDVRPLTRTLRTGGQTFEAGQAFAVSAGSSNYRLIKNIFEMNTEFGDVTFYDASAWTVPLAFGLDMAPLTSDLRDSEVGSAVTPAFPSVEAPSRSSYGYAFTWDGFYAPRAANRLLKAGVNLRVSKKESSIVTPEGEVDLGYGGIYVSLNPSQTVDADEIYALIETIAREDGVVVHPVTTGTTPTGPDFGSLRAINVPKPSILLLVGGSVRSYDSGEMWYMLDHHMHLDVTLRDVTNLRGLDWSRYTHLVLPDGGFQEISAEQTKAIDAWIKAGGTLIGSKRGALWAVKKKLIATEIVSEGISAGLGAVLTNTVDSGSDGKDEVEDEPPAREAYADKEFIESQSRIRGAIFQVDVDNTHPLGFGYRSRDVASYRDTTIMFSRPNNSYGAIAVYPEDSLLAGFASDENVEKLSDTAMMLAERRGQGAVIIFADNMNFRGHWLGTSKLFLNSVFFSKVFTAPGARFAE